MPTPGQQSMFDTDAYRAAPQQRTTGGHLFDPAPYDKTPARPSRPDHVQHTTGGEQLKMFMTPREIHHEYQPLDADRESSYGGTEEGTYQSKSWDTGHTYPTDINEAGTQTQDVANRRARGYHYGEGGNDSGTIRRTAGGGKYRIRSGGDAEESDEELWDRKLQESQEYSQHGQHEDRSSDPLYAGGRGGVGTGTMGSYQGEASGSHTTAQDRFWSRRDSWENRRAAETVAREDAGGSLYDSIASEGVKGPIRLGREIGSMGKKEIVGGHHRLAAATDSAPDRLVPVLHDQNIHHAREGDRRGGYPYS